MSVTPNHSAVPYGPSIPVAIPIAWWKAVRELADRLPEAAFDMGGALSCSEADALARVIALVDPEGAAQLLVGHATSGSEEEDDAHWAITQASRPKDGSGWADTDAAQATALLYVLLEGAVTDDDLGLDELDERELMVPIIVAVHNGVVQDNRPMFVPTQYLVPISVLQTVQRLLAQHEAG